MIRAALLDGENVFLRMDVLEDPSHLTAQHLPQIQACDLPPGRYRWIPDKAERSGGAFWPIDWPIDWIEHCKRVRQATLAEASK